jgi:hypothetical protein
VEFGFGNDGIFSVGHRPSPTAGNGHRGGHKAMRRGDAKELLALATLSIAGALLSEALH